jgi:hypothetical protein
MYLQCLCCVGNLVVSLKTEEQILSHKSMSVLSGKPLLRRLGYHCIFSFALRGGSELWRAEVDDFSFGADDKGPYVCYQERCSKNYKATMSKFQPEHFLAPLYIYDAGVIDTFQRYFARRPKGMKELFLNVIPSPGRYAWYSKAPMGLKPIQTLVKQSLLKTV